MKTLNALIESYTKQIQLGELQIAYKGILEFLGKLRSEIIRTHSHYEVSSLYQGYMDMSYFSLSTKHLKEKGLKIAIVYLHDKGDFEVWLSARNRNIAKSYAPMFNLLNANAHDFFHDINNPDAIIESVLIHTPNFENQSELILSINQGIDRFIAIILDDLEEI